MSSQKKVFNVVIIVLIGVIVFYFAMTFITMRGVKLESESVDLAEFVCEVMKGNKTVEDIDAFDTSTKIKDTLKGYHTSNFYTDTDKVIVCEEVDIVDSILNRAESIAAEAVVDGVFNYDVYQSLLYSKGILVMEATTDEVVSDVHESPEAHYYTWYHPDRTSDIPYEVNDNKLYVNVSDLIFNNGTCKVSYKGFEFPVYRDALEKRLITETQKSTKYQSLKVNRIVDEVGKKDVYYRDNLGNEYLVTFDTVFGKVSNLVFE